MNKYKFTTEGLVDTEWNTAEDKAKWLNKLADFVRAGFSESKWTKALYYRLSMSFGHIAHYDMNGFYSTWFSTEQDRYNWLTYIQERVVYGDPEWTWSDAERKFTTWLSTEEGQEIISNQYGAAEKEQLASAYKSLAEAQETIKKLECSA